MDISSTALVNASTQMQQSQVAQTAQVLIFTKAMDIEARGALALLQARPLATSGDMGTRINTMAWSVYRLATVVDGHDRQQS